MGSMKKKKKKKKNEEVVCVFDYQRFILLPSWVYPREKKKKK